MRELRPPFLPVFLVHLARPSIHSIYLHHLHLNKKLAMSSPIEVVNMSPEDYRARKVALITGIVELSENEEQCGP